MTTTTIPQPSHEQSTTAESASMRQHQSGHLLGAADIRRIAADAGIKPTKKFGQNFVIDPGTVRKIVHESGVSQDDTVLEVGPGLGSLTLALLEAGTRVTAIEIDPALAQRLPGTVATFMPDASNRLHVINHDALTVTPDDVPELRDANHITLVANLPYNVATPIILTLLERFGQLDHFTVMVQKEVADRLAAKPGSKIYGTPSVKLAWYGHAERSALIGRNVFWPAPNVDSALVTFTRYPDGQLTLTQGEPPARDRVFTLIDAAFGQRRKTLHAALKHLVPQTAFEAANIDPTRRGETLTIDEFTRLAAACDRISADGREASA